MSSESARAAYDAITFDELLDFALGTLDPALCQRVAQHLTGGCQQCEVELARVQQLVDATRTDLPTEPPSWVVHRAKQIFVRHEVEKVPRTDRLAAFLMDTQTVIGAITLAVVAMTSLTGAYVWRRIPTAQAALLKLIAVPVEIRRAPDGVWAPASDGAKLEAGMALRTGRAGAAELHFPDGSTLELGENSFVRFEALHTLTGVGPQVVQLDQSSGPGRYQVSAGGPGGGFDVVTPVARIQGRDTRYDLLVDEDGTTTVQVHRGTVTVAAGDRSVDVSAGQLVVISPTAPAAPLRPAPFTPTATPTPEPTFTSTSLVPALPRVQATTTLTPTATLPATATRTSAKPAARTPTPKLSLTPIPTPSPSVTPSPLPTLPPSITPSPTPVTPTPAPPTRERPTDTPKPPTDTPVPPPTDTPVPPPTDTPVPPPTDTPVPPPTDTPKPITPPPIELPSPEPTEPAQ